MTFDGVELVLQEDGSITLGTRRAMTKNQTTILKLVLDLYTVVQALINQPDQKWNASSLKKLLTGDNNNKSAVLTKGVTSGILSSTKQGNSDIYTLHEKYKTLSGLDAKKAILGCVADNHAPADVEAVLDNLVAEDEPDK
jgi:hypothetical protein